MAGNVKIRVECPKTGVKEFEGDNVVLLIENGDEMMTPNFISKGSILTLVRLIQMALVVVDNFMKRWESDLQQSIAYSLIADALTDYIDCHITGKDYTGSTIQFFHTEKMDGDSNGNAQTRGSDAESVSKAKRYSLLASILGNGADLLCKDLGNQDNGEGDDATKSDSAC